MKSALTLAIIFVCFPSNSLAVNLEELFRIAKENNCELTITKDTENHFLLTPKYQIFWCKKNDEYGFFDLVINTLNDEHWKSCSGYIPVQSSDQSPIWVETNPEPYGKPIKLNEFWYVNDGKSEHVKENLVIASGSFSYGLINAVGQVMYCYNNTWVMYGFH